MLSMLILNVPILGLLLLFGAYGQPSEKTREEIQVPAVEASIGAAENRMTNKCDTLFQKLNTYNSDRIGMSCGWGGVVTENVTMMAELASYRCYGLIDSLMDAPNGSVKYLATLALDMAMQDSLIQADSVLIKRVNASEKVYVTFTLCEGCTGHDMVIKSIGTLIENKKKNRVLTDVRNYLRGEWTRW
ncbi:MAG TPA: hypothetical protein DIW47_13145 [Bacteroidetes bacterium]|nr:hypothetical protein [Bacteroidota bacterium]